MSTISRGQAMPIEPGATYVFDLGYYDFGWWAKMDKAGAHRDAVQVAYAAYRDARAGG
ncbi:hypothetical protein A4A59_004850 [Rhizobium leguminosarum]|uniref:Uncharacterized protein n=1 Tax=Rhizobium leguminosarum TaxID=384 RepID=A0ACD5FBS9_RHILE